MKLLIIKPKCANKTKKKDKFLSGKRFGNWKILNCFNKVWNLYFPTYCQNSSQTTNLEPQDIFKSDIIHIYIIHNFNDFQNWNFSVLWLKWTQAMKMKQNQIFSMDIFKSDIIFHWSQNTKIFQLLILLESFNFIPKVNKKK